MEADLVKHYIDWAVKAGFAVIDINIPKYLTGLTVSFTPTLLFDRY